MEESLTPHSIKGGRLMAAKRSKTDYIGLKVVMGFLRVIAILSLISGLIYLCLAFYDYFTFEKPKQNGFSMIKTEWQAFWIRFTMSLPGFFSFVFFSAIYELIQLLIRIEENTFRAANRNGNDNENKPLATNRKTPPLPAPDDSDIFDDEEYDESEESEEVVYDDVIEVDELKFDDSVELEIETPSIPTPPPAKTPNKTNFVSLTCPHCGRSANAPAKVLGKKVRCSGCEEKFVARQ